jgi:undecaprenyl-diphosphatase
MTETTAGMGIQAIGKGRSLGITHRIGGGTRMAAASRQVDGQDGSAVPVLRSRAGSLAERFAGTLGRRHPAAVFFAALLSGFALLAILSIGLGLLVTDVLVGALGGTDESTIESIAADRTPFLTDVSAVGSAVGGAPLLPILVALIGLVCAVLRKWRIAAFAVFVLVVESATYRVTSLAVPRHRPSVHRLEDLPVNASYPSGHTAAAIAVYAGLVLLLTSKIEARGPRIAAWAAAVALPIFVALSRMYRGMHHPLDVAGGGVIGIGAILVLLFACRAAEAAVRAPVRARTARARAGRMQGAS